MSQFELWSKNAAETGKDIYTLEGENGTGLYQSITYREIRHNFYRDVVYHVWIDSNEHEVFSDYKRALDYYKSRTSTPTYNWWR